MAKPVELAEQAVMAVPGEPLAWALARSRMEFRVMAGTVRQVAMVALVASAVMATTPPWPGTGHAVAMPVMAVPEAQAGPAGAAARASWLATTLAAAAVPMAAMPVWLVMVPGVQLVPMAPRYPRME